MRARHVIILAIPFTVLIIYEFINQLKYFCKDVKQITYKIKLRPEIQIDSKID